MPSHILMTKSRGLQNGVTGQQRLDATDFHEILKDFVHIHFETSRSQGQELRSSSRHLSRTGSVCKAVASSQ